MSEHIFGFRLHFQLELRALVLELVVEFLGLFEVELEFPYLFQEFALLFVG